MVISVHTLTKLLNWIKLVLLNLLAKLIYPVKEEKIMDTSEKSEKAVLFRIAFVAIKNDVDSDAVKARIKELAQFVHNKSFSKERAEDGILIKQIASCLMSDSLIDDFDVLFSESVLQIDLFDDTLSRKVVMDWLEGKVDSEFIAAVKCAKEIGIDPFVDHLCRVLLEVNDSEVHLAIIEALEDKCSNQKVISALSDVCRNSSHIKVVQTAIYTLNSVMNTKESRAAALQLVSDEKDVDRLKILALGLIRTEEEES